MSLQLIGPFTQIITMQGLPAKGALKDDQLHIVTDGGILIEGKKISAVARFAELQLHHPDAQTIWLEHDAVAFPGIIDCHTHLAWAGSRAGDFAKRNAGVSYQEIAAAGGGIWSTVTNTRLATEDELLILMNNRLHQLLHKGITTVEVKSGYGLSTGEELKLLRCIKKLAEENDQTIVPTCLAAHMMPRDFGSNAAGYLQQILDELVPVIQEEQLCNRFDIFIEEHAFDAATSIPYLQQLKSKGFDITVHGDQFTTGGSAVAVKVGAKSVDHLEVSGDVEINLIAKSDTVAVALPGATIGLGCSFSPARKLLDAGACLAISSDWNPGSAPHGDLLSQAAILATFEKLSNAEVWAGITTRAAQALGLKTKGILAEEFDADIVSFPTADFREVLYQMGALAPNAVWVKGERKK